MNRYLTYHVAARLHIPLIFGPRYAEMGRKCIRSRALQGTYLITYLVSNFFTATHINNKSYQAAASLHLPLIPPIPLYNLYFQQSVAVCITRPSLALAGQHDQRYNAMLPQPFRNPTQTKIVTESSHRRLTRPQPRSVDASRLQDNPPRLWSYPGATRPNCGVIGTRCRRIRYAATPYKNNRIDMQD